MRFHIRILNNENYIHKLSSERIILVISRSARENGRSENKNTHATREKDSGLEDNAINEKEPTAYMRVDRVYCTT
jgi:hypothetical protein